MCAKKTEAKQKKNILFTSDFYSDITYSDMIYAVIIRSPFAYGKLKSIDFDSPTALPENYRLITKDDIPGNLYIETLGVKTPVFCDGEIQYKGEPLGLLTGPDKKILHELQKKLRITLDKKELQKSENLFKSDYNALSVSPYSGTSLQQSTEALRQSLKVVSNETREIKAKRYITKGNPDQFFTEDENQQNYIIKGKWCNSVSYKENKETEGCFCNIKGGNLHIFSPVLWISQLMEAVKTVTGFDSDKIILNRTNLTTRNTNSMWLNGILASQTAVAAIVTEKPVMLCLSRSEQQDFIENPAKVEITHKTAVSPEGQIMAMDINIEVDTGALNPFSSEILDRFVIAASGIYTVENLKIKSKIFTSHTPPCTINLSALDAQVFFAIENQIQKICEETNFTPLQLRLKNFNFFDLKKQNLPFSFAMGRAGDVMTAVCKKSDFNRKYAVYRLAEKGRVEINENSPYAPPLRGIGMACAFEGNGYLGTNFKNKNFNLQVNLREDEKLVIASNPPSPTMMEIWSKMIYEHLGIDRKNIIFEYKNEESDKDGQTTIVPDALIGNISVKTHLLLKCLEALKKQKGKQLPITVKKTLSQAQKSQWNQEAFEGSPFFSTSFGACVVEVDFDPCTYREKLSSISVVIDCGKVLNAKAAETEVKLSIQRCLSTLMTKEKLKCNKISVQFAQSDNESKQIGGLINSILPAAYTSALSQALAKTLNYLPLQNDSLFKVKYQEQVNENSGNS